MMRKNRLEWLILWANETRMRGHFFYHKEHRNGILKGSRNTSMLRYFLDRGLIDDPPPTAPAHFRAGVVTQRGIEQIKSELADYERHHQTIVGHHW